MRSDPVISSSLARFHVLHVTKRWDARNYVWSCLSDAERTVFVPPYVNIGHFPVLSRLHDVTAPPTLASSSL
jgi:hypothetical protein